MIGVTTRPADPEQEAVHASVACPETTVTSENRDEKKVPGLLEMLAQVPDTRKKRGRRYALVFVLAVAACCALAGAKTYREIGDQAADLPQDVLARLGGRIHPLKRAIIAPSEKRIRTLIQAMSQTWQRALADADHLAILNAIWTDQITPAREQHYRDLLAAHLPPEHRREPGHRARWLWRTLRAVELALDADQVWPPRSASGTWPGPAT